MHVLPFPELALSAPKSAIVSQRDLLEWRELRRLANLALDRLEEKHDQIRQALEKGAAVEPGKLKAELQTRKFLILGSSKQRAN
ncbi:MAG TPA: hypothetical protein VK525_00125 [Candidatus Saccharimonadales bacterium]|nr:hypothetical protein [Candidatus Saccharimonadales bacterium]